VCLVVTMIFTVLCWPMFWLVVWYYKTTLLTIIIPTYLASLIQGYIEDYIYERLYVKKRNISGMLDSIYFFISLLSGITDALKRLIFGLVALLIGMTRLNAPCFPAWILKYKMLDEFYKTYMSYVYA